jgi:translation initiation factor 3 subunit H
MPVTGQLLGLDVDGVLEVTHSFGMPQDTGEAEQPANKEEANQNFQIDYQKCLRDVNMDYNTVGWYQTTHLGQYFRAEAIESQYTYYQKEDPCSIFLVYDPFQAEIGKPSFKALRLTSQFLSRYEEWKNGTLLDVPCNEIFEEIPIYVKSPAIVEAFMVDWTLMDPTSNSQIESLDTENQVFLERNMHLLIETLDKLQQEQQKMQMYERAADKGKGKGKSRQMQQPKQLDTMVLSQQIQNYCKQINGFSCDSFGKLFLLSNKPATHQDQ